MRTHLSLNADAAHLFVADIECLACKRVVQFAVPDISKIKSDEGIIAALDEVCELMPRRDQTVCKDFLEENINELIPLLIEEDDPALVCTLVGACVP